ncbi:MAG: substrate-binding domain-containing protein [Pirellulaceae bacterium]
MRGWYFAGSTVIRQSVPKAILLGLLAVGCAAVGCGGGNGTGGGAGADTPAGEPAAGTVGATTGKTLRIAVIPKGASHEFWKSVHAGAEQAAQELGSVEIVWKGPALENDIAGQVEVVKNMVTRQVDAICLAPNSSVALVDAVREANDEGIPVVIFDSGLGEGAEIVAYVATDNERAGQLAAQQLATAIGGKGDVIMLRYSAGSESTEQREKGFLDAISKIADIKVLSSDQYGGTTTKSAMDKAQQLLLRHQDEVDGIFAVCESNCNGTLEALEQSGLAGKVKFVAFDPSERLIAGLSSGKVHGIVLQDPVTMGYLAVKTAVAKLRGEQVEPRVSTGEFVATPENMQTEQYQKLLHPRQFSE